MVFLLGITHLINQTRTITPPHGLTFDLSAGRKVVVESPLKPQRSFLGLVLRLLLLLLVGLAGVAAVCRLTDMKKEAMCAPINVAVDNGLQWAREQAGALQLLVQDLSAAARELLESSRASKN